MMVTMFWGYAILEGDKPMVAAIMNGWPFVAAIVAPMVALLYAYFGILKTEQKHRLDAAEGNTQPRGLTGLISSLIAR
jgi:hypothetical protein